jgi:hypothetical protein
MAALREETDRVGHIESTITSIQSSYQVTAGTHSGQI